LSCELSSQSIPKIVVCSSGCHVVHCHGSRTCRDARGRMSLPATTSWRETFIAGRPFVPDSDSTHALPGCAVAVVLAANGFVWRRPPWPKQPMLAAYVNRCRGAQRSSRGNCKLAVDAQSVLSYVFTRAHNHIQCEAARHAGESVRRRMSPELDANTRG
jgi:hypothetical protein